jgi:NTE family protein
MSSLSVNNAIEQSRKNGLSKARKGKGYNLRLIRSRLAAVKAARQHHDNRELLFVINEGIHGNLGGIGNADLFKQARPDELVLIREYLKETCLALHDLANSKSPDISPLEKADLFRRASQCYGHSALMLSGAGSLMPYHIGVVKALHQQNLLPSVISGSSGGALVAAMIGTRSPAERDALLSSGGLTDMLEETLVKLRAEVAPGKRLPLLPVMLTEEILIRIIDKWIPDLTFGEAYELSGIVINISITPATITGASRLLNATTSPHVYIREAVRASCAVPGVFPPVELCAKGFDGLRRPYIQGQKWIDGSVGLDLPSRRLGRLYGVNHFITSQTNPAVLWAVKRAGKAGPTGKRVIEWATDVFRANLKAIQPLSGALTARLPWVRGLNHLFYSVAGQEYTADINILPGKHVVGIHEVLALISLKQTEALIADGKKQTEAQIELIRNCTMIRKALDEIMLQYGLPPI